MIFTDGQATDAKQIATNFKRRVKNSTRPYGITVAAYTIGDNEADFMKEVNTTVETRCNFFKRLNFDLGARYINGSGIGDCSPASFCRRRFLIIIYAVFKVPLKKLHIFEN